jgi:alpha-tubulin suppressor-like RCC1 family protein
MRNPFAVFLLPILACLPDLQGLPDFVHDTGSSDDSGPVDTSDTGARPTVPLVLKSLSAGSFHTCGLTFENEVVCWGRLDETDINHRPPPPSGALEAVAVGYNYSCGINTSKEIVCWGGVFSDEFPGNKPELPQASESDGAFTQIDVGWDHGCAVTTSRVLHCWDGSYSTDPLVDDQPSHGILAVSTSGYHACVIRTQGSPQCWGYAGDWDRDDKDDKSDTYGKLFWDSLTIPDDIDTMSAIGTGRYHTCGLDQGNGNIVRCWGNDDLDQVSGAPMGEFDQITVGEFHNCVLNGTGEMSCWGWNDHGQATPLAGKFLAVSAGENHTCALDLNHEVQCWGDDQYGQSSPPLSE